MLQVRHAYFTIIIKVSSLLHHREVRELIPHKAGAITTLLTTEEDQSCKESSPGLGGSTTAIGVGPRSELWCQSSRNGHSEGQVAFASIQRDPQILDMLFISAGVHLYKEDGTLTLLSSRLSMPLLKLSKRP